MKLKNIVPKKWIFLSLMGIITLVVLVRWVWLYAFEYLEYSYNTLFSFHNIALPASPSKNVLLFSNSKMGGGNHLEYALPILRKFLEPFHITELLLIPYASPDVRDGVNTHSLSNFLPEAQATFRNIHVDVKLLDPTLPPREQQQLIANAQALYFTGGNTFQLIKSIYDNDLLELVKDKINRGTPVIGVSAGTVIHGPTMQTTNDMPVAYPTSFDSLRTVPFQINAHYNNIPTPGFHGETRDDRLKNYLEFNRSLHGKPAISNMVFGLKEGTAIHISGTHGELVGFGTRPGVQLQLDEQGNLDKKHIPVGSLIDNLINL
jgi:dipeptidase E